MNTDIYVCSIIEYCKYIHIYNLHNTYKIQRKNKYIILGYTLKNLIIKIITFTYGYVYCEGGTHIKQQCNIY